MTSRKPAWREVIESGWHVAVIALALRPVARRVAQSEALSAAAVAALLAGAVWHVTVSLRADGQ